MDTKAVFFEQFAAVCDQLVGYGIYLNGIPIENIVRDLRRPLAAHLIIREFAPINLIDMETGMRYWINDYKVIILIKLIIWKFRKCIL